MSQLWLYNWKFLVHRNMFCKHINHIPYLAARCKCVPVVLLLFSLVQHFMLVCYVLVHVTRFRLFSDIVTPLLNCLHVVSCCIMC